MQKNSRESLERFRTYFRLVLFIDWKKSHDSRLIIQDYHSHDKRITKSDE